MIDYDAHRWRDHLFDIRGSMLRQIVYRVLLCVLWSAGVVYVHEAYYKLASSPAAHTLIGVALGLLLVFRTNASYDRFWEGRKQWGAIVNESRNLARMARAYLGADPALADRVIRWAATFPWATMHLLRGQRDLGPAGAALPPDEVRAAAGSDHPPFAVARRITLLLDEARRRGLAQDYLLVAIDANVQQLVDYMGGCERIHKTPLPFAYVVHLRRALILYCFTLPFALVSTFDWWTIPATFLIAYTLFGIEEIGVEIEDPFGLDENDLPLEAICATIEANLSTAAGELAAPREAAG